ncbi:MAG: 2-amino-4-hydroxy-6-hydroxymethyldihydropteridine diphosphokinase, partial [Candidatus Omnitrophota bacterium]
TVRWGPRIIDLDILFYSGRAINSKILLIPHPRIFQRDFVIRPLLEIL